MRGRQFVIFPEGTRLRRRAPPDYKTGIGMIYSDCGVPCLPIALNSGLFWPRRTFMRYPGTLVVEFLDPLPPGLPRDEFLTRMQSDRGARPIASLKRAQASRSNCSAACCAPSES